MEDAKPIISADQAKAYTAPGHFRRGDSIVIDPKHRRIVEINGEVVPPELHTDEMQKHVDAELDAVEKSVAEITSQEAHPEA